MRHAAPARQAHCLTAKVCHAGMADKENMKYSGYRLLPTFAVALALCGCGALERRPDSTFSSGISRVASADASREPVHEIRPADSVVSSDTNMEPLHETRPTDSVASADANVEPSHKARPADQQFSLHLHVFGLSYHPDRQGTRLRHLDNELNVGFGLGHRIHDNARGEANVEAGFFKDSGRNWAKFAGMGYQFKFGERWKLGADLLAINSPTYNKGRSFIAPIPRLTYDFDAVKLNATYIPRFAPLNDFAVYAIYLTVPLHKW